MTKKDVIQKPSDVPERSDIPKRSDTPKKRGHNLKGRIKGVKNKSTIFKEVMRDGFEARMKKDFKKVVDVVLDKAMEGDMVAAKMLFDRVIPQTKSIDLDDLEKSKGLSINISIGSLEDDLVVVDENVVSEQ